MTYRIATGRDPVWRDAALYTGYASVDDWVRDVVWHYLDHGPGRFIPYPTSPPLFWKKRRTFAVTVDGESVDVRGAVSGPFGIYNAPPSGRPRPSGKRSSGFLLVHLPSGLPLVYQRRVWDCQNAADELVAVSLRWDLADGTLRENPQVDEVLRRYARRR
jgi:hypothetical protein